MLVYSERSLHNRRYDLGLEASLYGAERKNKVITFRLPWVFKIHVQVIGWFFRLETARDENDKTKLFLDFYPFKEWQIDVCLYGSFFQKFFQVLKHGIAVLVIVYPDRSPVIRFSWLNNYLFWSLDESNNRRACPGRKLIGFRTWGIYTPIQNITNWFKNRKPSIPQDIEW